MYFQCTVALALGKTLGELQDCITEDEWDVWREFFQRYPFDDYHRYHRPAAMVAASFGGELDKRLEWLQPQPMKNVRPLRPVQVVKLNKE